MSKPKKAVLPPAQPLDPSLAPTRCEAPGCAVTKPVGEMIAYKVTRILSGHPQVAAAQCPAIQHFGCSHEHAALVAHACLDEHIIPAHQAALAAHEEQQTDGADNGN